MSESKSVHSVSSLNRSIKSVMEGNFPLVWVQGEISNFKAHSSGHFYFSLKDKNSQINGVMFRGYNSRLSFKPKDGMEVVARARVTVYEPRGSYQILCEDLQRVGEGALQEAFEKLKNQLKSEGLFDKEHKKELPPWPKHVAVITSPTGAAIRDMIQVLNRRNKGVNLTVVPSLVQGQQAAPDILKALKLVEKLKDVDVLILARGGGSMEDLWCFNDESVVRAIHKTSLPVISAVGHEIDFTISDFVADLRAPTPSAAAELVIKSEVELEEKVQNYSKTLRQIISFELSQKKSQWQGLNRRLIDPRRYLQDLSLRCDDLVQRLNLSMDRHLSDKKYQVQGLRGRLLSPRYAVDRMRIRLTNAEQRLNSSCRESLQFYKQQLAQSQAVLDSLSPLRVVDRGYSLVTNKQGKVIKKSSELNLGEDIRVRMAEGHVLAEVKEIEKKNNKGN